MTDMSKDFFARQDFFFDKEKFEAQIHLLL